MKALKARITKGLTMGSRVATCDNSGAKVIKIYSVKRAKTVKGRLASAGIGDFGISLLIDLIIVQRGIYVLCLREHFSDIFSASLAAYLISMIL